MLWNELEQAGCFRPAPWLTLANAVLVAIMYATGFTVLLVANGIGSRLLALFLLAFGMCRLAFLLMRWSTVPSPKGLPLKICPVLRC